MKHLIGNYQKTVSKLKCLNQGAIYSDKTTKFVNPVYRGKQDISISNKDRSRKVISIPMILHIVY